MTRDSRIPKQRPVVGCPRMRFRTRPVSLAASRWRPRRLWDISCCRSMKS